VFWAALPERGLGIGLKAEDGATRAAETALIATLVALDALDDKVLAALAGFARPVVYNRVGDPVGEIRPSAGWPASGS
jgi:L-asparaginase II